MQKAVKQYFSSTNNLLYSYLVSLPLFLIYEVLIFISQPESDHIVRISVDAWIKYLFTALGVNAVSVSLLIIALLGFFILYKEREVLRKLRFKYFPIMLAEAMVYAVVVATISRFIVSLVLNMAVSDPVQQLSFIQKIALSLGAGLYEELFFRNKLHCATMECLRNDKRGAKQ